MARFIGVCLLTAAATMLLPRTSLALGIAVGALVGALALKARQEAQR